jgi:2-dehydro-3-deoxyphosphogluconate aldolase / (4S)-4-hydroxy-2-oxoglutarate aldolase
MSGGQVLRQDVGVAVELPLLGEHRVIVNLPAFETEELLPACETLCQEGFTTWALPVERINDLAGLLASFGRRARIAVSGVTQPADIRRAAEAGAAFVATDLLAPKLLKVVPDYPVVLGGLTPTELRAGLAAGAAAVQVVPADALSADYAQSLPQLLGHPAVIATGRLTRTRAAAWLQAGAVAVWPQAVFADHLAVDLFLDELRSEIQTWRLGD